MVVTKKAFTLLQRPSKFNVCIDGKIEMIEKNRILIKMQSTGTLINIDIM